MTKTLLRLVFKCICVGSTVALLAVWIPGVFGLYCVFSGVYLLCKLFDEVFS